MPRIRFMKLKTVILLVVSLVCLQACHDTPVADNNWSLYGNEYNNQRFSHLAQINRQNVKQLKLAWKYQTGRKASFQTTPLIIDGVMYITTPFNDVIALQADRGEEIWRYRHELRTDKFCCGPANRGAAIAGNKVYIVTIDGRLIALDKTSGKLLWDETITDTAAGTAEQLEAVTGIKEFAGAKQTGQTGYSLNMAPQVYDGIIYVGITGAGYGLHLEQQVDGESVISVGSFAGGNHGLRGFISAHDADTGEELWRWYSVPEEGWEGRWTRKLDYGQTLNRDVEEEKRNAEKYRDSWRLGGGSIWTTPAIDPELNLLYIGTGNPSPQMEGSTRPGDNLYTVSLVALDARTGELRWHYQQVPHDRWGYDVASPPVLFDYVENGKTIKAVGQASKLGWFFIHDRETGRLIRISEPFIQQENLFALPSETGTRIVPGTLGAASWSPVAYHPQTHLVYVPGIYQPSMFYTKKLTPRPGKPWQSYTFFQQANEPDHGTLTAIDVTTGKIIWQNKIEEPMVGGALVTSGNLVFTGEGNGRFNAFDADTGELLWHYQSSYGVNAPPVSFSIDGKQYISVAAGGNNIYGYPTGDEILTFTLE